MIPFRTASLILSQPDASNALGSSVLACDFGGSHLAVAISPEQETSFEVAHLPVSRDTDLQQLVDRITEAAELAANLAQLPLRPVSGIAMAMPGPFDYERGAFLGSHKFPRLLGADLKQALAETFQLSPRCVTFLHDAQAFLLGELRPSEATAKVVGITLGTGIGSAFAEGGRLIIHGTGVPDGSEIYHLPWLNGTVEDTLSTRGILNSFRNSNGMQAESVKEICAQCNTDPVARETMEEFGRQLGKVIQTYIEPFSPETIILGGGIARNPDCFLPAMRSQLAQPGRTIRISTLLERAAILGAARDWLTHQVSG